LAQFGCDAQAAEYFGCGAALTVVWLFAIVIVSLAVSVSPQTALPLTRNRYTPSPPNL
jgi:hypothetical protein